VDGIGGWPDTNFPGADAFSDDISAWDVSSVTSMDYMFYRASSFDADLSGWNVAVQSMNNMFEGASSLSACNRHRIAAGWGDDLISDNRLDAPSGACASHCAAGLCTAYPSCAAGFHGAVDGRLCFACPADMDCAGPRRFTRYVSSGSRRYVSSGSRRGL